MKQISKPVLVQIGLWCATFAFLGYDLILNVNSVAVEAGTLALFVVGVFSLLGAAFIPNLEEGSNSKGLSTGTRMALLVFAVVALFMLVTLAVSILGSGSSSM